MKDGIELQTAGVLKQMQKKQKEGKDASEEFSKLKELGSKAKDAGFDEDAEDAAELANAMKLKGAMKGDRPLKGPKRVAVLTEKKSSGGNYTIEMTAVNCPNPECKLVNVIIMEFKGGGDSKFSCPQCKKEFKLKDAFKS